jgi:hypothetical protein
VLRVLQKKDMNECFDVNFYQEAMRLISCHLVERKNKEIPKKSQIRIDSTRKFVNRAPERSINGAFLHSAAQSSYAPKPLPDWTVKEQLSLINAVKLVPSERSLMIEHCAWTEKVAHQKYLQLISEHVPSKSAQECEQCLKHLRAKRVAYFGQHHSHGRPD